MSLHRLICDLLAALFSSPCPGCAEGGHGGRLCPSCLARLPRLQLDHACSVCAEPFVPGAVAVERADRRCGACLDGRKFSRALAWGRLEGELRPLVHRVKFGGARSLAAGLGQAAAVELANEVGRIDAVVPVPLGRNRAKERGYNQAEALARGIARALDAPHEPGWLARVRETAAQTGLGRRARRENVRGAFVARTAVAGRRILLVDDVLTTGATAEDAARALLAARASEVIVFALARAGRDIGANDGSADAGHAGELDPPDGGS